MKQIRLQSLLSALALALVTGASLAPQQAQAQAYPNRSITIIIPYGPGTGVDIVGRIIGQKLSEDYSQPIVIKNMPGASGAIGAESAATSAPDGYTLALVPNSIFINQFLRKNGRDPLQDFVPIAPVGNQPYLLAVPLGFAPKTIAEVVALAKAKPGELNYTALSGSVPHFIGVMLRSAGNVDVRMVSYKSTTEAIPDVIAGRVQLWLTPLPSGISFVTSNKVRAMAVTGDTRSPLLPDVPTMKESGYPSMDIGSVLYMVAPRTTPTAIVNKLNADTARVVASKDVSDKLASQGLTVPRQSTAELLASMRAEQAKWAVVVKESGLKPE